MKKIILLSLSAALLSNMTTTYAASFSTHEQAPLTDRERIITQNRIEHLSAVIANFDTPQFISMDMYVDNRMGIISGSALFVPQVTNPQKAYKNPFWSLPISERGFVDPSKNDKLLVYRAIRLTPTDEAAANRACAGGTETWAEFIAAFKEKKLPELNGELEALNARLEN